MSEIVIYRETEPSRESLFLRLSDNNEVRIGQGEILSKTLSNEQLRILATALVVRYFDRTNKVIWPRSGPMLAHYQKEQRASEDELLAWMSASPAEENRERAPAYEMELSERRAAEDREEAVTRVGEPLVAAIEALIPEEILAAPGRKPRRRVD